LLFAARDKSCNIKPSVTAKGRKDDTSALPLDFWEVCSGLKAITDIPRPYDTMSVTFNYPVEYKSLAMDGD